MKPYVEIQQCVQIQLETLPAVVRADTMEPIQTAKV